MSSTPPPSARHSIPRPPATPLRTPSSTAPSTPTTPQPTQISARRAPGPPVPAPPIVKTRARDLLRKHYGLGVGPPPPSGRPLDPMDLAFDAKTYYEQLITTSSLPTLLKRENELLAEIRQLDGEKQSLVYNHHHELIAASTTIASMKNRAESLDADLELLKIAFSEISRLGAEVAVEQNPSGDGINSEP